MKQLMGLAKALRDIHEQAVIRQAEMIRDWSAGPERHEQAMIHVRAALLEANLRISQKTQYRVYSILHFVMPENAPIEGEPVPDELFEQEALWELAYQQQLNRQMCEECGEGMCPSDPERPGSAES